MSYGILALLLLIMLGRTQLLANEAPAENLEQKKTYAMSKEICDSIVRINDDIAYLASIGVSYKDVDPKNLPFESTSIGECVTKADETSKSRDEVAIARVACIKRHPVLLQADEEGIKCPN
jgi:hypothetical protein